MSEDLFIRRAYTHKGVVVPVEIDLIAKTVTLVEKDYSGNFTAKKWLFADRELAYMDGWLLILDAMKYAISEAQKVLQAVDEKQTEKLVKLLVALDEQKVPKKRGKK